MNKNETIIIERVANGYLVRPLGRPQYETTDIRDILVFQDMGYASAQQDYQPTENTLLGFIAEHFTNENSSKC